MILNFSTEIYTYTHTYIYVWWETKPEKGND